MQKFIAIATIAIITVIAAPIVKGWMRHWLRSSHTVSSDRKRHTKEAYRDPEFYGAMSLDDELAYRRSPIEDMFGTKTDYRLPTKAEREADFAALSPEALDEEHEEHETSAPVPNPIAETSVDIFDEPKENVKVIDLKVIPVTTGKTTNVVPGVTYHYSPSRMADTGDIFSTQLDAHLSSDVAAELRAMDADAQAYMTAMDNDRRKYVRDLRLALEEGDSYAAKQNSELANVGS